MSVFAEVLGKPFKYGARGPEAFDCYGLVRYLHKEVDGIELPEYATPDGGKRIALMMADKIGSDWRPDPDGRLLYMRINGVSHVAFNMRDGKMIHAIENYGGVRIERMDIWKHKIIESYSYLMR